MSSEVIGEVEDNDGLAQGGGLKRQRSRSGSEVGECAAKKKVPNGINKEEAEGRRGMEKEEAEGGGGMEKEEAEGGRRREHVVILDAGAQYGKVWDQCYQISYTPKFPITQ